MSLLTVAQTDFVLYLSMKAARYVLKVKPVLACLVGLGAANEFATCVEFERCASHWQLFGVEETVLVGVPPQLTAYCNGGCFAYQFNIAHAVGLGKIPQLHIAVQGYASLRLARLGIENTKTCIVELSRRFMRTVKQASLWAIVPQCQPTRARFGVHGFVLPTKSISKIKFASCGSFAVMAACGAECTCLGVLFYPQVFAPLCLSSFCQWLLQSHPQNIACGHACINAPPC